MSEDPLIPEGEPEAPGPQFVYAPPEPLVRPIWRFVVAAIFVEAADWVALNFASNVLTTHPILQDALYRLSGVVILLVGFHFMLRVMDEVHDREIIPALGFRRNGALREFALGAGISILLITLAVGIIALRGGYSFQVHATTVAWRRFGEVLFLLLAGATFEELSFRGYAFQRLTDAVGPIASIAIFSVWFGAVHLWNPHSGGVLSWAFFNTIAVGALFALAYLRTRALWMPIGLHFGWNFALGTVFGLPVSGLDIFSVLNHGKAFGPKWLTGGSYGVEASATGAVVIVAGLMPVLLLTRKPRPSI